MNKTGNKIEHKDRREIKKNITARKHNRNYPNSRKEASPACSERTSASLGGGEVEGRRGGKRGVKGGSGGKMEEVGEMARGYCEKGILSTYEGGEEGERSI